MAIVSVSLPDGVVTEMDAAIETGGYKGRSELMRTALRRHLQETARPQGHMHGSITVVYDEGNEPRISDARHTHHDVVLSMMHTHCEPEVCMDVLTVGGPAERVLALQRTLERMREVRRAVLVPVR